MKRNKRIFNFNFFDIKYYTHFHVEKIINDNANIEIDVLLLYKFDEFEKKNYKNLSHITSNQILKVLNSIFLYKKQQTKNDIEFIRRLKLYKKQIDRKKIFDRNQITLNNFFDVNIVFNFDD